MNEEEFLYHYSFLTPDEKKEFNKFVSSQGRSGRDEEVLAKYLEKKWKVKPVFDLNGKDLYFKIFKRSPINEKAAYSRLKKASAKIRKHFELFIVVKQIKSTPMVYQGFLFLGLIKNSMLNASAKRKRLLNKPNEQNEELSFQYYLSEVIFRNLVFYNQTQSNYKFDFTDFSKLINTNHLIYLLTQLRLICEKNNRIGKLEPIITIPFEQEIIKYCSENIDNLPSIHQTYYYAFKLLTSKDENHFQDLKVNVINQFLNFDHHDQVFLFTYLINHCAEQIRLLEEKFYFEALDLYNLAIKNKLFILHNRFLEDHFINYVSICCALKKSELTIWFFKEDLVKRNLITYGSYKIAEAYLHFWHKSYDRAKESLMRIDFKNPIHAFRRYILLSAIYFELKEELKTQKSLIKTFKTFITRHKQKYPRIMEAGYNFIICLSALISNQNKPIKKLLNEKKTIYFYLWLRQYLN